MHQLQNFTFVLYLLKEKTAQVFISRWVDKKFWYIYTMEYYAATKKQLLHFSTAWMNLEIIILNEISQLMKDKYYMISLICGI